MKQMAFVIFMVCILHLFCLINADSSSAIMIPIKLYILFPNNMHVHLLQTEIYYCDSVKNSPYINHIHNNICNSRNAFHD
jgi:hypothetical protein